jgi:hypothetical protein
LEKEVDYLPINLHAGELVRYVKLKKNQHAGKKGFVLLKTQSRRPARTDVYLIKFQHEDPREVDERWLERILIDDEVDPSD